MSEARDIDIKILGPSEVVVDQEKGIRVMQGAPTQIDEQGLWNPPGTEMIFVDKTFFGLDQLIRHKQIQST